MPFKTLRCMKNSLFCLLLLSSLLWSCASNYYTIQPETIRFDASRDTLVGGELAIAWQYEVLKAAGNRRYARKERQQGVSLLALRLANQGAETLAFTETVEIFAGAEQLWPLSVEEAAKVFVQRTREPGEGAVEVEGAEGIVMAASLFNMAKGLNANIRFVKELDAYYLAGRDIPPGSTITGLLALPVRPGTAFSFSLKQSERLSDTLPSGPPLAFSDSSAVLENRREAVRALGESLPSGQEQPAGLGSLGKSSFNQRIVRIEKMKDDSGKEGIVVLDVCIDQKGQVISANFSPQGSTTKDEYLLNLVIENVRKWEFAEGAAEKDCGKVTYRFVLK